jgi:hypothetical protein
LVGIQGLKKQALVRLFLYDPLIWKQLRCRASRNLTDGITDDFLFDELAMRHITSDGNPSKPDNLWLRASTSDLKSHRDWQGDVRKLISCGVAEPSQMAFGSESSGLSRSPSGRRRRL